jgi:hypothetical protein
LFPEFINIFLFVLLDILEVSWHFIQEESTIVFVTIGHILLVVSMLEVLEFAVHEWRGCEIESQRWLVRLI